METRQSQIQTLCDLADAVLGGIKPPTAEQVEAVRQAMSLVPLSDLGLTPPPLSRPFQNTLVTPPTTDHQISYLHIFEDAQYSLGIFCLPAGSIIPLHNHPGMTVFSRVLYGTLHVTSFDWKDASNPRKEALLIHDRDFTESDAPTALFPCSGGNIHQFTAVTDCAVLDLFSPPYSTDDGRDCTYYQLGGGATGAGVGVEGGVVVLEEFEPPEDFIVNSENYTGIPIVTKPVSNSGGGGVDGTPPPLNPLQHQQRQPREDSSGSSGVDASSGSGESGGSPRSVTPAASEGVVPDDGGTAAVVVVEEQGVLRPTETTDLVDKMRRTSLDSSMMHVMDSS